MAPLRVLFVSISGLLAGAERVTLEFIEGLDRRRFSPTVVVPEEGPFAEAARRAGVPVFVVPAPWWLPYTSEGAGHHFRHYCEQIPQLVDPLLDIIHTQQIDVVYSCTAALLHPALAALIARRPHVQHLQDLLHHPDALTVPFRSPRLTYSLIGALSAVVVCVGRTVRRDVGRAISDSTCRIVPLGFRPPPDGVVPLELPGPPGGVRVGLVGRVSPRKGIGAICEIVARVCTAAPEARFYWLGPGVPHHIERLRRETGIDGEPRLHFLGVADDVQPFMHAIDLLLHPSRIEAFPRVLVEAALAGRPSVATRCGGTEEIIEHGTTGLLAPVDDAAALAEAVLRLVRDPRERARLGGAARQRAAPLSMERYVAGMEQALLDAHAHGPALRSARVAGLLRAGVYAPAHAAPALRRLGVHRLVKAHGVR